MSDFPALDDQPSFSSPNLDDIQDTDFLKREQEILGDEFKNEKDREVLQDLEASEDEELNVFNQQFPDLDGEKGAVGSGDDNEFEAFEEAKPVKIAGQEVEDIESENKPKTATPSEAIEHWKQRKELEIKERDEHDLAKKEAVKKEAVEQVNLLYEEYEAKKVNSLKETKQKVEEFEQQRQEFFKDNEGFDGKSNVSWKKALTLLDDLDSLNDVVGGRDRSKFKELLEKLSAK